MSDSHQQIKIKNDGLKIKPEYKILVVDDSATIIALVTKMLEDRYIIIPASNGVEAWDILQEDQSITLVFSDMQMPLMNGLELLLKIRNSDDMRLAKLPVVMITGKTDTDAGKQAAFDLGATDFLGKPFDEMDMISRARAYVNTKVHPQNRSSDQPLEGQSLLASASTFHSIGCQALEFSREKDASITVVYIKVGNYSEIENIVGKKNAMSIISTIARKINDTARDEDVITRLGIDQLAVLYNLGGSKSIAVAGRLINHLSATDFEFEGKPLNVSIYHGFENSKNHDKAITFSELCMLANSNLQTTFGEDTQNDEVPNKESVQSMYIPNDSIFDEFKARGKKIGLWFALKSILNGNYDAIPEQYEAELLTKIKAYIKYASNKD